MTCPQCGGCTTGSALSLTAWWRTLPSTWRNNWWRNFQGISSSGLLSWRIMAAQWLSRFFLFNIQFFVIFFQVEVFSDGNVHNFRGRGSSIKLAEVSIILWWVIGYMYKVVDSVVQALTKLKLIPMVLLRWLHPSVPSDGLKGRQNSGNN